MSRQTLIAARRRSNGLGSVRRMGKLFVGSSGFFRSDTLKIKEVRAYTAAPIHPDMARQELQDFDYEGRGYPTAMT